MAKELVTVCIATYNHGRYIKKCLESAIRQKTTFEYKILVADDSSTDNTQEIIRSFAALHPLKISPILRQKNVGSPGNGLDIWQKTKSKYIAILDGDDYWTDSYKLQKQVDYLEKNLDCSFCFTDCQVERKNILQQIHPNLIKKAKFAGIEFADQTGSIAQTCTWLVKRDLLQNLPKWVVESYTGDWCMQVHFSKFGKGGYIPENTAVYRIHDKGIWSKLNPYEGWRKNLAFYKTALKQLTDKRSKKRLYKRIKLTIHEALELANIQFNKKEILYWLIHRLKHSIFTSHKQTLHSMKLLLSN